MTSDRQGIVWMISSCFFAAIMTVLIKILSSDLNVFAIMAMSNVFGFLIIFAMVRTKKMTIHKTKRFTFYLLRGVLGNTAGLLWASAIVYISLAEVTALGFTTPLFAVILGIFIFNEKANLKKVTALIIGFVGVLIIARPGAGIISYGAMLMLISALFWAFANLTIKSLTTTDSNQTILFYSWLAKLIIYIPLGIIFWQTPTLTQIMWIILLAISSNFALFSLSSAHEKADLPTIMPFNYTQIIFASILGYAIFAEAVSMWTVVGSTVILMGSYFALDRKVQT